MRRLNREHRGKDRATDVLSFPLYAPGEATPAGVERLPRRHRDQRAERRSARRSPTTPPLDAELKRLLIHGVLHLLGHDHERPRERARMVTEERRLAAAIGLAWPY